MSSKAKRPQKALPALRDISFPWRVTGGKSRLTDKQIEDAMMPILMKLGRCVKK